MTRTPFASVLAAALCAPTLAFAQADLMIDRPVTSGVQQPVQSTPVQQGPLALSTNPAGLALGSGGFAYVHEDGERVLPNARRGDGVYLNIGGLAAGDTSALALGASIEWIRPRADCSATNPCIRRTSLALAGGTNAFTIGGAWRWFDSDESAKIDSLGTLDLSAVVRPTRWISISAVGENLNSPNGTDRIGIVGAAVRPMGETLTLATEYNWDGNGGFAHGILSYYGGLRFGGLDILAQLAHPVTAAPSGRDVALLLAIRGGFGPADVTLGGGGFVGGPADGTVVNVAAEALTTTGKYVFGTPKSAQVLDLKDALSGPGTLEGLLFARDELDPYTKLALRLQRLADDDGLDTLVLKIRGLGDLTLGRVEELRSLLFALRGKGKHVVAWMEDGGDTEYYLATAAEKIYAAPQGLLEVNGFSSQRIYLRGLLRKIGAEPEFVKIGAYKSAPEQFTNEEPSPASAEETNALLDDEFARYIDAVAKARGWDAAKVKAVFDRGLLVSDDAVKEGLIDGVTSSGSGLDDAIEKVAGRQLPREPAGPEPQKPERWGGLASIGLIEVKGDIVPGNRPGMASADRIVRQIRGAMEDASTKAIVVRVESPGGDVGASELIWQALHEAAKKKPVIASFGDVAASGGYYVGSAASTIIAEPSTVTGSIGVFAGKADLSALLSKIGVSTTTFTRGEKADILTLTRPWTAQERQVMEGVVQKFYETFLQRVAEGRKMSTSEVHEVAQGRVWTGAQAKDRKLVDELGGLSDALRIAREKAGLPADAPVTVAGASGTFELPAVMRPTSPQSPGALGDLSPLEALELAARGSVGPTALEALMERARPLIEALASGRPLALAVDLPRTR